MAGTLRVRRSRGALSGFLLLLLGIWGALIPFAGPYFHFAYTPDHTWTVTSGRLWLEVLPGACAAAGGLVVFASRLRPVAMFGAWLAALGGAWFAVGGVLITLWSHGVLAGHPVGGKVVSAVEQVGFFTGLGIVIVFVAALAIGRFTVVTARDVALAEQAAGDAEDDRPAAAASGAATDSAATDSTTADSMTAARLTKVVPGRPGAADPAAAEQAAADHGTGDQAAADTVTTR